METGSRARDIAEYLIEELDGVQRHPVELRDKPRANLFDVSCEAVLWLEDHLAGVRVDFQDAREFERDLTEDQQD